MPLDDALRFFAEMVELTVVDFLANPHDKRLGCLACLTLASMTEHFYEATIAGAGLSKSDFKGAIRAECPPMGWVADVANATKHVHGFSDRIGFDAINSTEMDTLGVARFGWPFGGTEVLVGEAMEWRLSTLVTEALSFWRRKVASPSGGPDGLPSADPGQDPAGLPL